MPQSDNIQPDPLSKTQAKKDMLELQKLGEELLQLPEAQLVKMPIPEDLLDAVLYAHTLKSNEAKRRHLQYIGKKMREIDCTLIRAALKSVKLHNDQHTAQFHKVEQWREKLILGDDHVLQELLEVYPQADRQQLRQLIRKAKQDRLKDKKAGGEIALFRCLQQLLAK